MRSGRLARSRKRITRWITSAKKQMKVWARMRSSRKALLCVGSLLLGEAATAHHAPFLYDTETEIVLSGIVESFEWVQPHTWVELRVEDADGEVTIWRFEGMSPLFLGHRGWNRYSLVAGDVIEVGVAEDRLKFQNAA